MPELVWRYLVPLELLNGAVRARAKGSAPSPVLPCARLWSMATSVQLWLLRGYDVRAERGVESLARRPHALPSRDMRWHWPGAGEPRYADSGVCRVVAPQRTLAGAGCWVGRAHVQGLCS
jgi:hypothetical protein